MTGPLREIALVGAGAVARALGANAVGRGLGVTHWVRDAATASVAPGARVQELAALPGPDPAVAAVILAVPFDAVASVVPALPLAPGTVLIDATNPFGRPVPAGHASGAAVVAAHAPAGVPVVKAFNVLGAEHMAAPLLPDGRRPLLPVAGDDAVARAAVVELARHLDFDAVDVGGLAGAAVTEAAARYWGLLALGAGLGRDLVLVAHHRDGTPAREQA